jgi:hypothetical protein
MPDTIAGLEKDSVLDLLAADANVAQFVSFSPALTQRFSRVAGRPANDQFSSVRDAVESLLAAAADKMVNVRSYQPHDPKSREFVYGLDSADAAEAAVKRLAAAGLFTIVNETIDIHDGGVSGVVVGDLLEFAPEDTPRCVERAGVAALPRDVGLSLLAAVYGFRPNLDVPHGLRLEFSIHPLRRGVRNDHTIVWEREEVDNPPAASRIHWPNRFSRFVGDKVYGLLVAHLLGCAVPRTVVIGRRLPPFSFGERTGTGEVWLRTAPTDQVPGRYTTKRGWTDPYALLGAEDPSATVAAVLSQDGIDAAYSGSCVAPREGDPLVEGVRGYGDRFMAGRAAPERLPPEVTRSVSDTYRQLAASLGPVRFEWAWDGVRPWVLQLHVGRTVSTSQVIVPGSPATFHVFDVSLGLEALRRLTAELRNTDTGILLRGSVGITSHFGDLLRRAGIPSRIASDEALHSA